MTNTEDIINDYIRCTKVYLIVKEDLSGFFLWRPFVKESDNEPLEVLHHRSGNDAVNYFLLLLRTNGSVNSDSSRSQQDKVYRFNRLVESWKDSFSCAYLCNTLDELKIVNTSSVANRASYAVLFPGERVLWKEKDVRHMRRYVKDHFAILSLGQRMFEEDCFKKERERMASMSFRRHSASEVSAEYTEQVLRLNMYKAVITVAYGGKEEEVKLQPLPKAWLIYFIFNNHPTLYSQVLDDRETMKNYYDLCNSLSEEKRGRRRIENSSLKPGLIIRKINTELSRCCEAVGLIPGSVAVARLKSFSKEGKQVDVPKMLIGARIEIDNHN